MAGSCQNRESQERLAGFEERPDALISRTTRLQREIPLAKYKNANDLINGYIQFYRQPLKTDRDQVIMGSAITNRIVDALEAVRKQRRVAGSKAK